MYSLSRPVTNDLRTVKLFCETMDWKIYEVENIYPVFLERQAKRNSFNPVNSCDSHNWSGVYSFPALMFIYTVALFYVKSVINTARMSWLPFRNKLQLHNVVSLSPSLCMTLSLTLSMRAGVCVCVRARDRACVFKTSTIAKSNWCRDNVC